VVHGTGADERLNRIVTLGGSTTDPIVERSWPEQLAAQMREAGYRVLVYNGGVAGYSSSQELLKLLRDGLTQKPHVVVSLNGINDMAFLHAVPGHPMVHPYQVRMLEAAAGQHPFPILPNFSALAKRVMDVGPPAIELGAHNGASPFEQWRRNIRSMHALCGEFGVDYRCFLQPVLGIGAYTPTAGEEAMLAETQAQHAKRRDYRAEMAAFYEAARSFAAQKRWCEDLTDLFAGQAGVYHDARHLTPQGNAQVAKAVLDVLRKDGLIRRNVPGEWGEAP
jgi:lysophospholipase L1-like esterase